MEGRGGGGIEQRETSGSLAVWKRRLSKSIGQRWRAKVESVGQPRRDKVERGRARSGGTEEGEKIEEKDGEEEQRKEE